MNRIGFGKRWLVCVVFVTGGCGTMPDFLLDAGRDAVQETLEQAVKNAVEKALEQVIGQAVEQTADGVLDDLLDPSDASPALENDGEQ